MRKFLDSVIIFLMLSLVVTVNISSGLGQTNLPQKQTPLEKQKFYPKTVINLPGLVEPLFFGMTKQEIKKIVPAKLREQNDGSMTYSLYEGNENFEKKLEKPVNYNLHLYFDKEGLLNKIEMDCGGTEGCDKRQKLSEFWKKLEKQFGKVKPKTKDRYSEFKWVRNGIVWKYHYYYVEESDDVVEMELYVISPK